MFRKKSKLKRADYEWYSDKLYEEFEIFKRFEKSGKTLNEKSLYKELQNFITFKHGDFLREFNRAKFDRKRDLLLKAIGYW